MDTFGGFGSYRDHAFMDSPRHSSECAHEEHNGTAVAQESASLIRANFLDSMKQLQAKMTAENEDAKKRNRERKKARARERRDTLLMNTYLQELFPTAFGVLKESAPDPILEKKQKDVEAKKKVLETLETQRKKFYTVKSEMKSIKERIQDKKIFFQNYLKKT